MLKGVQFDECPGSLLPKVFQLEASTKPPRMPIKGP
jgi:hypothetical protein